MDTNHVYDLVVIGGGINGVGIAADAAGRGLSVLLCEREDLASQTSSASSKLIHGGIRYLEQYEFKLVRESLREQETLLKNAPHLIHPLEFVLPHNQFLRPKWMIRIGMYLYDHLAKRRILPRSSQLDLRKAEQGNALKEKYTHGFRYYDCRTDDARLVIANAQVAQQKGAEIATHCECTGAKRQAMYWELTLKDRRNDERLQVHSKAIVNAAGPWVTELLQHIPDQITPGGIQLVQGSHIVVPKLYEGEHAYILQNQDQRIVFAIPYRDNFTLIGTTDVAIHIDPRDSDVTQNEIHYLCDLVNQYFRKQTQPSDVVWQYWGARALFDDQNQDPSKITREYHLAVDDHQGKCPILTVFGGKLTTYRNLAEHALAKLEKYFPDMGPAWTAENTLPGGDIDYTKFDAFVNELRQSYEWADSNMITRYANNYGTLAHEILKNCHSLQDLGEHFGADLYQCEVDYLINIEWARSVDDIIWRRTKLGLYLTETNIHSLANYLDQ